MGRHETVTVRARPIARRAEAHRRPGLRSPVSLIVFAFVAATAFLFVNVVDPYSGATADPYFQLQPRFSSQQAQSLVVGDGFVNAVKRDGYKAKDAPPPPPPPPPPAPEPDSDSDSDSGSGSGSGSDSYSAPSAAVPDPGSAQDYAHSAVLARGWGEGEFNCLVSLWNKESGWRVNAFNASSGAYGIPQSLPGNKMASAGPDWETNAGTQIEWGLGYIASRYGTPCGAWAQSESAGYY